VYPDSKGSCTTNKELNISFTLIPDYTRITKVVARGNLFTATVDRANKLEEVIKKAVESIKSGISAIIEVRIVIGY
jgi:hypothetical protein